ncbi:hypothetical protein LXL04_024099 [Taraxacum kok-saghyz]
MAAAWLLGCCLAGNCYLLFLTILPFNIDGHDWCWVFSFPNFYWPSQKPSEGQQETGTTQQSSNRGKRKQHNNKKLNTSLHLTPVNLSMLNSACALHMRVHITQGDHLGKAVIVSWVTMEEPGSDTVVYWSEDNNSKNTANGIVTTYTYFDYTSGFIHRCHITVAFNLVFQNINNV